MKLVGQTEEKSYQRAEEHENPLITDAVDCILEYVTGRNESPRIWNE